MRVVIANVFLAVGVPGLAGCSVWGCPTGTPEPQTYEGEVDADELARYLEDDGTLSELGCADACRWFGGMDGGRDCVHDPIDTADTADTGAGVVSFTCTGVYTIACEGRRPPGLHALPGRTRLERTAAMEAASVHAFVRLHRELRAHGAPEDLADRCLSAARDEVRHARVVARMAGVPVPRPRVEPLPLRDLGALALDNAVEGCVHETWAAVEAHLRAARGRHRAAWSRIAADETRHAQLAWDIDAWLTTRGVARPDARRAAAARLVRGVAPARRPLVAGLGAALWG